MTTEAFIYEPIRTPRGRGKVNGALHHITPVNLVVGLLHELVRRNPRLDPAGVDDVILGVVTPIADQGADIARTAVLVAGWPDTVGGVQLNRFCASGLEAVNQAAARVRSGWEDLIVAGGVESMSRVPMGSDGGAWMDDPEVARSTGFVPQGVSADLIATLEGFSRPDVDAYAARSQQRAAAAWASGAFDRSVVPVVDGAGTVVLQRDEHMRPDTTVESLGGLKPSFAGLGDRFDGIALSKYGVGQGHGPGVESIDHVHTAGNSSGIVDGASLMLVGSAEAGRRHGLVPRARVVAAAVSGSEPTIMLTGPAPAAQKALALAGLTADDLDLVEMNEAFSAAVLRFQRDLGIADDRLNVNGGAIALGHPLGATGAMLLGTLADELDRRQARRALATLCVGGGMGVATIIERISG
jgi:acetyl-CoA C-acetyltransferase